MKQIMEPTHRIVRDVILLMNAREELPLDKSPILLY